MRLMIDVFYNRLLVPVDQSHPSLSEAAPLHPLEDMNI